MGAVKPQSQFVYEIKRMRVHEKYRRQGIAQGVLTALIDFVSFRPAAKFLMLDTSIKQLAAQSLYEKNGFIKNGETIIGDIPSYLYVKEIKT